MPTITSSFTLKLLWIKERIRVPEPLKQPMPKIWLAFWANKLVVIRKPESVYIFTHTIAEVAISSC
jgi:hypothetical protein